MNVRWIAVAACVGWIAIDIYMSVATAVEGVSPLRLFQWDASNFLGKSAYSGGLASGAVGLFADYIVSAVWASVCLLVMNRVIAAAKHPVLFGTMFGIVVMLTMIFVVVPLGHAQQSPMTLMHFIVILVGHTAGFGIPVALSLSLQMRSAPDSRLDTRSVRGVV